MAEKNKIIINNSVCCCWYMLNSYCYGARDSAGNKSTTFLANSPIYARTICRWRRLPAASSLHPHSSVFGLWAVYTWVKQYEMKTFRYDFFFVFLFFLFCWPSPWHLARSSLSFFPVSQAATPWRFCCTRHPLIYIVIILLFSAVSESNFPMLSSGKCERVQWSSWTKSYWLHVEYKL